MRCSVTRLVSEQTRTSSPHPSLSLSLSMAVPRGCLPLVAVVAVFLAFLCCRGEAAVRELKVGYYAETCPEAEDIVRETMARTRGP